MIVNKGSALQVSCAPWRALSVATFALGLVACGAGGSIPPLASGGSGGTTPTGEFTVLYSFSGGSSDGASPTALIQGSDGNFYGTTQGGAVRGQNQYGTLYKVTPTGAETVLHLFGAAGDGSSPQAGLVQASDGNFYGTTSEGGTNASCDSGAGCGTLFKWAPSTATYTLLYSFGSVAGDGENPMASLIQGSDGNLYGTTSAGGANGDGTVFKFDLTTGTESVFYSFAGGTADGQTPFAPVVQSSNGNLYGTTVLGGADGTGMIYGITPAGAEGMLYSFGGTPGGSDGTDGVNPYAGLLLGSDDNLYGTTALGGAVNDGTMFTFQFSVYEEELLWSFVGFEGFKVNASSLIQASNGNFYGTTWGGGQNCLSSTSGGCGTIFMYAPSTGDYTVLYNFGSFAGDGKNPIGAGMTGAAVVMGSDGSLYGTTGAGGANGYGTVFKLTL